MLRDRLEAALLHLTAARLALGPPPPKAQRGRHRWLAARRSLDAAATVLGTLQDALARTLPAAGETHRR